MTLLDWVPEEDVSKYEVRFRQEGRDTVWEPKMRIFTARVLQLHRIPPGERWERVVGIERIEIPAPAGRYQVVCIYENTDVAEDRKGWGGRLESEPIEVDIP